MTNQLNIYNTLTQKLEIFEPIHPGKVNMYVCGPTVYDYIHIGNARPVIVFDMVKRVLEVFGYQVKMVSNITDVDDKIIDRAKELNITEEALTETYIQAFKDATVNLGSQLPNLMPKATDYVTHMIAYIKSLEENGYAYETSSGIYFRVDKVKTYGSLSKQNQHQLESAVRVSLDEEKENPRDFSIWKKTTDGLHFDSPWGPGRPGWHTECAVMNHEIFEGMIDIHGGGSDLMFPHHENERAHAEAHDHHGLAKYWMHNGRLDLKSEKMSKSLGNMVWVKDIKKEDLPALRMLMLAHHYRQPINYSDELLDEYKKIYHNIEKKLKMTSLELMIEQYTFDQPEENFQNEIKEILAKDFDTPNVITRIYQLIKDLNKSGKSLDKGKYYDKLVWVFNVLGIAFQLETSDEDIDLYYAWQEARAQKNYEQADIIRKKLMEKGYL